MEKGQIKEYRLTSDITLSTASEVDETLKAILQESPVAAILSMEKVSRIDSSGLGAIFRLQRELKRNNIGLALTNVCSQPRHLFNFSMLDQLVRIYDSNEAAISALDTPS